MRAPQEIRRLTADPPPQWIGGIAEALGPLREDPPFEPAEYRRRHDATRVAMEAVEVDAVLNLRMSSIDWLTGFHSVSYFVAACLVDADGVALIVPESEIGRGYIGSCADSLLFFGPGSSQASQIAGFLAAALPAGARIGLDLGASGAPAGLVAAIEARGLAVVDCGQLVERLRLRLSAAEQAVMRRAAAVTAAAWEDVRRAAAEPSAADRDLAAALLASLASNGDSLARGNVAVATAWRGGVTHSSWNGTPLGNATYLEFAGAAHRYSTPVMRTVLRGEPSAVERRLAGYAGRALAVVIDAIRPGVEAAVIARQATSELGPLPPEAVFHYNFGYPAGVGQITTWMDGASFFLTEDNHEELQSGMAFHLPMSFRRLGQAGVGLSQTVLVTEDGAEVLTADAGPAELVRVDS